MSDLKKIIGLNLQELRKKKKYTQQDLANELQYSDKAISKWEKGDSLPDIETLYQICNIYGVTLDYLTHEGSYEEKKEYVITNNEKINKIIIVLLSIVLIWCIGLITFVYCYIEKGVNLWTSFIWPLPASAALLYLFNKIWGKRVRRYFISSLFSWLLITAIYLESLHSGQNIWMLFLLGIPIQIIIILWSQLKHDFKL